MSVALRSWPWLSVWFAPRTTIERVLIPLENLVGRAAIILFSIDR
jgi:hypothetical protein